jgi:hypothetical protein
MKPFVLFVLSVLCVPLCDALTDSWSVDVQQHASVQRTYKRGEPIDMRITLRDGLKPLDLSGASARWYWYTNAVDNLWWTNSVTISAPEAGLVQATWTPAMDTGAAMYYYWIGVWQAGSASPLWRVTGNIRMLPSPGVMPNALPMPIRTLDFAAIAATNAPWVTSADFASALQTSEDNMTARLSTNRTVKLYSPDGTQWIDGTGGVWRISATATNHTFTTSIVDAVSFKSDLTTFTSKSYVDASDESNRLAIAVLSTNRVTQLHGTNQWIDGNGAVWKLRTTTNLVVTFSTDFTTSDGHRPPQQSYPHPFIDAGFDCFQGNGYFALMYYPEYEYEAQWGSDGVTIPARLDPMYNASGYATISYQVVADRVDNVALKSDLPAAFTNVPLYSLGGSNYYWRWSSTEGTYITTGVAQ